MCTKWSFGPMIFLALLIGLSLAACIQPVSAPTKALPAALIAPTMTIPELGEVSLKINRVTPYGHFNGIDYVRTEGHLLSAGNDHAFDAPFEIVAPAKAAQGNGRLLVEPYHFFLGAGARENYLTPALIFEQGFSHAAICWQVNEMEDHPCHAFTGKPDLDLRIIAGFARLLKGSDMTKVVGKVDKLYGIGFSNSADPLLRLLLDPLGQHLFDLTFVLTTGWPLPRKEFAPLPADTPASLLPAASAGRVIVVSTEADIVLFHAALLRDDGAHPNYRSYEVAGVSHIPAPIYDANQLDWLPVLRALFEAGDRWIMEGVEPPPSRFLENDASGALDPVYERVTGIARDENLNAEGGIRLPDVTLGRSQFIAVDVATDVLVGKSIDLTCTAMADGSVRFPDHVTYVSHFTQEAQRLVDANLLLPDEAARQIEAAEASNLGTATACP